MTDPIFYSPTQVYINKPANGGVQTCPVYNVAAGFGIGNNQQVIAGATGIRIRVMGYAVQSSTSTQSVYGLKNGSGGASLSSFAAPPSTANPFLFPITDSGYFETTTGTGLFVDVTAANVTFQIWYILYTP